MTMHRRTEELQDRLARRLAERLQECADQLPPHVEERLKVARYQAMQRHVHLKAATSTRASSLTLGQKLVQWLDDQAWFIPVASALPILLLVAGLVLIQYDFNVEQINATAEVDGEILVDSLPPEAYSDSGFAQFLRQPAQAEVQ